MIDKALKDRIVQYLRQQIDSSIEIATASVKSAKESREIDTKSSAGDKYETGREMMQAEVDKNTALLHKALMQRDEFDKMQLSKATDRVMAGSLLDTSRGIFFLAIAVGTGRITLGDDEVYVISLASPVGKLLLNKMKGERFEFQGKEYVVQDIV